MNDPGKFANAMGVVDEALNTLDKAVGIGTNITGSIQNRLRRKQAGEQFDKQYQLALDKFGEDQRRYNQQYAMENLWNTRNFSLKEKQILSQLSQADQVTRQQTLNRMKSAWDFEQTKEGIESKKRTSKAFTAGILNAIAHSKRG